jgi:hypothetical protein
MKLIKKKAEFVGYVVYSVGAFPEWRCPDKDCGMSVMEEYKCCPYCGRRLKFDKSRNGSLTEVLKTWIKQHCIFSLQ